MGSGCVNQSFAGGLATVLKDYYIFVSQLERQHRLGQLTLQKVRYNEEYIGYNQFALELDYKCKISSSNK